MKTTHSILVAGLALSPLALYAGTVVLPHTFSNGTTANATEVNANFTTLTTAVNELVPAGVVVPFAGNTAPTGYLFCNGQAVSRFDYPALFTALGTTYGAGDGSTTFNLPDLRGRVPAGQDNMGGTAANRLTSGGSGVNGAVLGAVGGAESHTLSVAEMPSHTHIQNAHNHGTLNGINSNNNSGAVFPAMSNNNDRASVNTTSTTATNQNTGGGGAHNNTQPTLVLKYIIKT